MLSRLLRTVREHALFAPGERVLVAVSGGPDSTALLRGLVALGPRLEIGLAVATVDHGLRPESASEAAWVAERAGELGLSCCIIRVDVAAAHRASHGSWQDTARRVRLEALSAEAARAGCQRVALGHTADDQAETILFRILRGTGVRGLAGIPHRRDPFVRPLLDVRRSEVLRFLRRRSVAFLEDPSNLNLRFARARLRQRVLPVLAKENPRIVEALLELGHDARRAAAGESSVGGNPAEKRVARAAAAAGLSLSRRVRELAVRLASEAKGTRLVSTRGGRLEIRYGEVFATRTARSGSAMAAASPMDAGDRPAVAMTGPGTYRAAGLAAVRIESHPAATEVPGDAIFDSDRLVWPLRLRALRPGDRIRPRGGRGSRKLQDLLVDAKVPRSERARLPVVTDAQGTILYVPGLRPSEAGRPLPGSTRLVVLGLLRG